MILGVSMVRNEADIIEPFVRHNLKYLDALHIVEHGSVDGTDLILEALRAEGLPLTIRKKQTRGYDQDAILTEVVRSVPVPLAFVFLDADEFLHGMGPDEFRSGIEGLPEHSRALVPWRTFMVSSHFAARHDRGDFPRVMAEFRRRERPQYYKALLRPGPGQEYGVLLGAHDVTAETSLARGDLPGLFYAHYPVRSPEQMELKSIVGWLGYALRGSSLPGQGRQWKEGFRRIVNRGGFDWESLPDVSMRYAQKIQAWSERDVRVAMLDYDYHRRYDHLRSYCGVLGLVARTLEQVFP